MRMPPFLLTYFVYIEMSQPFIYPAYCSLSKHFPIMTEASTGKMVQSKEDMD